jgi:hypothetical protein
MRAIFLYHPNSDHAGMVADYAREFQNYKRKEMELTSLESVEGADLAELYGVTVYPAILVMSNNGSLQHMWQGTPLPLMDELSYYIQTDEIPVSHMGHVLIPLPA